MVLPVSTVVFWLIALMVAVGAVVTAGARNILHAAFALCTAFLGVGALYVFLHADFVAAVQLIVYVGGILVLIMFAVMFSSNVVEDTAKERRGIASLAFGTAASVGVFAMILLMVTRLSGPLATQNKYAAVDYVNTVGVQPDLRSTKDVAADEEILARYEQLLNPKPTDKLAGPPATALSNADLTKRLTTALGDVEGKKLFDTFNRQRGHIGLGHKLVGDYLLPFEVASILLLAALIGAVVIVRKELA